MRLLLPPRATLLLLAGALALSAAPLHAQYTQLSTNPVSLIFGVIKVEGEASMRPGWAIEGEVSAITKGQRAWSPDYDSRGYRLGLNLKRYFIADGLNEGYYGFAYARHVQTKFTDFVREGEQPDQRDFDRNRKTIGFGLGYAGAGADGFYYGFSLGIGRHVQNEKVYTSTIPGEVISRADDDERFDGPFDVYGRVSVGLRIYSPSGKTYKDEVEAEREAEEARLREAVLNRASGATPTTPATLSPLEARRLRHRIRNGDG